MDCWFEDSNTILKLTSDQIKLIVDLRTYLNYVVPANDVYQHFDENGIVTPLDHFEIENWSRHTLYDLEQTLGWWHFDKTLMPSGMPVAQPTKVHAPTKCAQLCT